jgi:hypothetical protein
VDTVNNELFVSNHTPSITVYARSANGNVAPIRTIAGVATGLTTPGGMALDTVNDELLVPDYGNNSVRVFPRSASGNVAPLRALVGAATGLSVPVFAALGTTAAPPPPPTSGPAANVPTLGIGTLAALALMVLGGGMVAVRTRRA